MTSTIRMVTIFLIVSAIMAAVTWIYHAGGEGARNSIERQDNEAGNSSDRARSDFDACHDGLWDFGAGKCRGPAPGGGN